MLLFPVGEPGDTSEVVPRCRVCATAEAIAENSIRHNLFAAVQHPNVFESTVEVSGRAFKKQSKLKALRSHPLYDRFREFVDECQIGFAELADKDLAPLFVLESEPSVAGVHLGVGLLLGFREDIGSAVGP